MVTIKLYTDIEQSKKLAKILPIESADMCLTFVNKVWNPVWGKAGDIYQLQKNCYEPDYTKDEYVDIDEFEPKVVSCWSQAALYNILPVVIGNLLEKNALRLRMDKGKTNFNVWYEDLDNGCCVEDGLDVIESNPVDAYYKMIIKLHERKLI